jgi:chemotaxis protein MotB
MMRIVKLSVFFLTCAFFILANGCVGEQDYKDLKVQNNTQRNRISQLESELQATKLQLAKFERDIGTTDTRKKIETDALNQKIAALQEDIGKKKALIISMQQQLFQGGMVLPVELSTMLEDFAKGQDMVVYDPNSGVVKFKSDLLFEPGSDKVTPAAEEAIKSLSKILDSEQGKNFDVIIAGHTDDIPIQKPQTRQQHPTNWYLSAHRAIAVLNVMTKNNVAPERISVRGFGEFRPIAPNKPNNKGNPQNRRVEIYIVPKGM